MVYNEVSVTCMCAGFTYKSPKSLLETEEQSLNLPLGPITAWFLHFHLICQVEGDSEPF